MAQADSSDATQWSRRAFAALILLAGVIVPGVAKYSLTRLGYATLGSAIFVLGYGAGVLAVWYVWLRPMEFTGPT